MENEEWEIRMRWRWEINETETENIRETYISDIINRSTIILNNEDLLSSLNITIENYLSYYIINDSDNNTFNFEKLKTIKFKNIDIQDKYMICPLTQEKFNDEDEIIQLDCKHYFSSNELKQWLQKHNTCPLCRTKIT